MRGSFHLPGSRLPLAVSTVFLGVSTLMAAPPAAQQNWPTWRGPLGTGIAPAATPPLTWSETENIKWKVKLPGSGASTPIIWGDQVFILTAIPTGKREETPAAGDRRSSIQERRRRFGGGRSAAPTEAHQFALLCLDRRTGKTLWQKVAREAVPHEGHHQDHGYASYSPVTDGAHVIASFGSRGIYCYDMKGELKWEKDLGRMQTKNTFGEGSSPGLHGDTVVVNWDHEGESFITALEKTTGKPLWRQPRDEETSWSTPIFVEHGGATQVIVAATNRIRSYDLKSGKPIWECGGMTANVIPTPVAGDGLVYATSGFRGSALLAIRLGRTGDLTGTDAIAWSHGRNTPYVPSPLLYGGRLYFFASNNGILSCHDAASGEALFGPERLDGLQGVYASPAGAAGRIYLVGRNGTTLVIKDAPKLEVLATNRLGERIDASPALSGTDLFLRGHEHLYCIGAN